jgi:iron complex transport system permease protein
MRAVRGRRVILISAAILLTALVLAAGIGAVRIPPGEVVRILLSRVPGVHLIPTWSDSNAIIFWEIRLPRVLLGALVGMALSVAGGAYQGMFKNPLADPYVLGVSSGAALGAAIAIAFLSRLHMAGVGAVPVVAFAGGLLAVTLVYRLAAVGRRVPTVGLLLAGVAVGSFSISMVSLILYFTDPQARDGIIFWMMGGLGGASWQKVGWLLPYLAVGIGTLLFYWRELNALLLGEDSAQSLGVDVEYLKKVVLAAGSLLTAAAVAFSGAIGFVGLIVPHLVRFLVGPDHRYLLPAAGVVGAVVLVAADTVARSLLGAAELPVGLIMAVLGGPFFLWLLRRKLKPADA